MLSQNLKGILSIIGSCLFYLVSGSVYSWGNMNIYVSSYFKHVMSDETSITFPAITIISNIFMLISFSAKKCFGFRGLLLFSLLIIFFFTFYSSFSTNFWLFFCSFGVVAGGFTGFFYMTLLMNVYKYFPSNRGLVGGIVMCVYGFSSIIVNFILLECMNPENYETIVDSETKEHHFPEIVNERLPSSIRVLSYYYLILMIIGTLLQYEYKDIINESVAISYEMSKNEPLINSHHHILLKENSEISLEKECNGILDVFRSKILYLILLSSFFSIMSGHFLATNFKNYGMIKISDDGFLTLVGGLSSVSNGIGRLFWGCLYDKLNFKKTYFIILLLQIINMGTMRYSSENKITYLFTICLGLFCQAGHFVIFPPFCLKLYGEKIGLHVTNIVFFSMSISCLTQYLINLFLRKTMGFDDELYLFLGFNLLALLICCCFNLTVRINNSKGLI